MPPGTKKSAASIGPVQVILPSPSPVQLYGMAPSVPADSVSVAFGPVMPSLRDAPSEGGRRVGASSPGLGLRASVGLFA